jgi:hypothetical protein
MMRAFLVACAVVAISAFAGCNALIGLGEPTVGGEADGSLLDGAIEGPDAPANGEAGVTWPAPCSAQNECPSGTICDPYYQLCEPTCSGDQVKPCPSNAGCFRLVDAGVAGDCVAGDYVCLGSVTFDSPTAPLIHVALLLTDVPSDAPPPLATVRACAKNDAACANPVATSTSDALGRAEFVLPTGAHGFDGYLDITGTSSTGEPLMEQLFYNSAPWTSDVQQYVTVGSASSTQTGWPATFDPARAQMIVLAVACSFTPAFGALLAVSAADSRTTIAYPEGLGFSYDAGFPAQDNNALAYVANVPGAGTTLTTTYQGVRVGTMDVVLRPGVIVIAYLEPTP